MNAETPNQKEPHEFYSWEDVSLTILNLIFVNSYYALSLLYLVWFLVFGAILLISNRLPTRD